MYLKSIKAQGFKSFADKLDIEINEGITGIVGPNGSGKSNIVDAVRWVLGEQSLKSLRGSSSMSDVIFSGSESREAQKRAMVSLTFSNDDGYLKTDFKEVEIKRVVYNTGENEYFLNNQKVRLKDITDLFIESGAGNGAFNIISQGNVTDIVNSKSGDRRVIFESAAGVLKYKKRKEESLRKLEKTEENLLRIKLIIDELSLSVEPLKEQSVLAQKYVDLKSELESMDIALICKDILDISSNYNLLKQEIENLNNKLREYDNFSVDSGIDKLKLEIIKLDEEIDKEKEKLLNYTKKISELNSEKLLTIERQKYDIDKNNIDESLIKLKENILDLEKNVDLVKYEIKEIENNKVELNKKIKTISDQLIVLKVKRSNANTNLYDNNSKIYATENKIKVLENSIDNDLSLPVSVRNILNNTRLNGVHNTIGKLIDVDEQYLVALDTALGFNKNFVVVDDENTAIECIDYLKNNKLGRATFFPLNIIKSRKVSDLVLKDIKKIDGYLGVLSSLVKYDSVYENIIENQLGNILVVENANCLKMIGKLIDYKYRIVSLDGEILHVGGSLTGGSSKQNSIINEKNELTKLKDELNIYKLNVSLYEEEISKYTKEINELEDNELEINKNKNILDINLNNKKDYLNNLLEEIKTKNSELHGLDDLVDNKLDNKLILLLEEIQEISKEKDMIENNINSLVNKKSDLNDELQIKEHKNKENYSNYNNLANELKKKEVLLGKDEVKLDALLISLNDEYNLTYEKAILEHSLEIETNIAREKVLSLKKEINSLGEVNLGSISEYERVSKRYDFLNNQMSDLELASSELKSIIDEMDEIMIDKFSKTFIKIKEEYKRIFKLMFKGGKGDLELTDPDDLLNTGIDLIAIPPGKKINNTVLLSGGEKALTAIVLLFAMLEVKSSPFVILDEAEAALDEANVDMLGKYLNNEKQKSQFILITHKKRMMEYADTLYGITMQESGVSKIVSARLEEK